MTRRRTARELGYGESFGPHPRELRSWLEARHDPKFRPYKTRKLSVRNRTR